MTSSVTRCVTLVVPLTIGLSVAVLTACAAPETQAPTSFGSATGASDRSPAATSAPGTMAPTSSLPAAIVESAQAATHTTSAAASQQPYVATLGSYGPVRIGMTSAQFDAAVGSSRVADGPSDPFCIYRRFTTPTGRAEAIIHRRPEDSIIVIQTPAKTKTDRGVGDGSTVAQVRAAYASDHLIQEMETADGPALFITSRSKPQGPQGIGFAVMGTKVGPPMVGGVPGFEFCSG